VIADAATEHPAFRAKQRSALARAHASCGSAVPYPGPSSALISQRSIEARVPGVSAGSIASRAALGGRHVVGRFEDLDHDRGALVRVVEDLDALGRDVRGRPLACLNVAQASGQVIRIDVREPDHACVHGASLSVAAEQNLHPDRQA
jgi:hypothetical protein